MPLTSPAPSFQPKFSALSAQASGALALGAGLALPFSAFAGVLVGGDVVVTDINVTVETGQAKALDLTGDGEWDLYFNAGETATWIKSASGVGLLTNDKFLERLAAGQSVAQTSGNWTSSTLLHLGDIGPWGAVGAQGYAGLRFATGDTDTYNYGWLEITRGSVILGQFGLQSTPGAAAAIPAATPPATAVPEPSSLLLLASGAAGVLALRRRRQQRAGAPAAAH